MIAGTKVTAQPSPQWIQRFNGLRDSTDVAVDITVDNQGNSYVTGYSSVLGLLTNIVTIKYNTNGILQWRNDYGTPLCDEGTAIILDNAQQYVYVTGFVNGLLNLTLADYVIIKYDVVTGNQVWDKRFNRGLDDRATAIAVDRQNNPIITGISAALLLDYDYLTVKYDQGGNVQWSRVYDGFNKRDSATGIAVDNNNNVIVTGFSKNGILLLGGNFDYATVKYNSAGTQQWAQRYNGSGNGDDRSYGIVVDNSNDIIVTGSIRTTTSYDYGTIYYYPNGIQYWVRNYNGSGNSTDRAYAIVVDNSNNIVVTGESRNPGGTTDYVTVKYQPNGNTRWSKTYNGSGNGNDRAYAIDVDNNNNVYVTGEASVSNPGDNTTSPDYGTVKYDENGNYQWDATYNGTGNGEDRAYAIDVDNTDQVYISGSSQNSNPTGSEDYTTIKYPGTNSPVVITSNSVPLSSNIFQNYPNPFNPETKIKFDVDKNAPVKILIYDMYGAEISELFSGRLNPGTYQISWNAKNYPSGAYFYRLLIDGSIITKKMILLK
jgi:hypothetical protein